MTDKENVSDSVGFGIIKGFFGICLIIVLLFIGCLGYVLNAGSAEEVPKPQNEVCITVWGCVPINLCKDVTYNSTSKQFKVYRVESLPEKGEQKGFILPTLLVGSVESFKNTIELEVLITVPSCDSDTLEKFVIKSNTYEFGPSNVAPSFIKNIGR